MDSLTYVTEQVTTAAEGLTLDRFARDLIADTAHPDDDREYTLEGGKVYIDAEPATAQEVIDAWVEDEQMTNAADAWLERQLEVTQHGKRGLTVSTSRWETTHWTVLVTYGGPNVWMDFHPDGSVTTRGYYGSRLVTIQTRDELDVYDFLETIYATH